MRFTPARLKPQRCGRKKPYEAAAPFALTALHAGAVPGHFQRRSGRAQRHRERWLRGVWPVVQHAKAAQMHLDTAIQPQPVLNAAPLALAYIGGRCKLVFSMRGKAQADTALDGLTPTCRTLRSS